jgi:hypothetical protein
MSGLAVLTGADWVGMVGVLLYVAAYGGLAIGRMSATDARYYVLNGLGSLLMIYSLLYHFNYSSFISQLLWLLFTIVGFVRTLWPVRDKQH